MDFAKEWLTSKAAQPESQALIDQLSQQFRERESSPYAEVSGTWLQAAYNLRREWFA